MPLQALIQLDFTMGLPQQIYGLCALPVLTVLLLSGCKPFRINSLGDRIVPSNTREWTPELSVLPLAETEGELITLRNIRNINYVSDDNFVIKYFDRTIRLEDVRSVDFVVTPFQNTPAIAHTMLSFGLADGSYLGISVEIRNEKDEDYSALLGFVRQYEITYVIADERDLIRVRTRHRDADVYVYPSIATAEQSQQLFVDVLARVNKLSVEPEFYNTLRNNCTTNLVGHVNQLKPDRIAYGWRILLPGFSAEYAYDLGLLDNRIPFEDLKTLAYVNDLADRFYDDPQFSQLIRSKRNQIPRMIARQNARQPALDAAGGKYLDERLPQRPRLWR